MKFFKFLTLSLAAPMSILGCSSQENCDDQRQGNFAIDIRITDADCDYVGTVENEETGEIADMECSDSDGQCSCRGGDEFATYRVLITNLNTNEIDTTVIEVTAAPPAVCVERKTIEPFSRMMGEGGAGGADANDE